MTEADRWAFVQQKLTTTEARMDEIQKALDENTLATLALGESTEDVVKAFRSARGAFEALELLGRIAKPLLWLFGGTGVITIIWYEIKRRLGL